MKAKYIKLLHYLNEQDNWVSSTQLAEKFGLSKRTIKSYIADIQDNESDFDPFFKQRLSSDSK